MFVPKKSDATFSENMWLTTNFVSHKFFTTLTSIFNKHLFMHKEIDFSQKKTFFAKRGTSGTLN